MPKDATYFSEKSVNVECVELSDTQARVTQVNHSIWLPVGMIQGM